MSSPARVVIEILFYRPGRAVKILALFGLATAGCTLDEAVGRKLELSPAVIDQTHWELIRALPADAARMKVTVIDDRETDFSEHVQSILERDLSARGFTIDNDALYTLRIQCRKPVSGTRGLPVTSRFIKVVLDVLLVRAGDQEPILHGQANGIVEESAVSWISGYRQTRRRLERALSSASGKTARYLATVLRSGGQPAQAHVVSQQPAVEQVSWDRETLITLAVLDFDVGEGVNTSVGQVLADLCRDVIGKTGRFILLDRNNIKAVLGEQDFAAAVRCTDTSCLVEYGRVLQAQKIVHGRASRIGQKFVLYMSLSDVDTAVVDATEVSPRTDSIESLADVLPAQATRLVQGF